jgi:hypothetical protein
MGDSNGGETKENFFISLDGTPGISKKKKKKKNNIRKKKNLFK